MNKCNIPVYVINCTKDIDRREYMANLMKNYNIDFEFVVGVVPNEQEVQCMVDKEKCLRISHRLLTQGEVGVAMSHLKIYQKMLDNNISKAIIFEDDVFFDKKNKMIIEELDTVIPMDWELILLGYGGELGKQRICHHFVTKSRNCFPSFTITKPLNIVHGSFAYMINLQGAKRMLAKINFRNLLYQPIDSYIGCHHVTNLYCVQPTCVFINHEFKSVLSKDRDINSSKSLKLRVRIKFMNNFTSWIACYLHVIIFPFRCFRLKITYAIKNKDNFSYRKNVE